MFVFLWCFFCVHVFFWGKKPSSTNDKRRVPSVPPCEHIIIVAPWVENIQPTPAVGTKITSDSVDGSEIRRSPVEVGSLSHYLQFLNHQQHEGTIALVVFFSKWGSI